MSSVAEGLTQRQLVQWFSSLRLHAHQTPVFKSWSGLYQNTHDYLNTSIIYSAFWRILTDETRLHQLKRSEMGPHILLQPCSRAIHNRPRLSLSCDLSSCTVTLTSQDSVTYHGVHADMTFVTHLSVVIIATLTYEFFFPHELKCRWQPLVYGWKGFLVSTYCSQNW